MEKNNNNLEVIDLRIIIKKIWSKRKLYYIVLPIVCSLLRIYSLYTSYIYIKSEFST